MTSSNGIGLSGQLPWPRNKGDLKWFRDITTQTKDPNKFNVILMGRNTWEKDLAGKCLPGRLNAVISKTLYSNEMALNLKKDSVDFFVSLDEAIGVFNKNRDKIETVFIIGGGVLYQAVINKHYIKRLYITHMKQPYKCDTFFPDIRQDYYYIQRIISTSEDMDIVEYVPSLITRPMEVQYLALVKEILEEGNSKTDRTGVGTLSLFGKSMRMKFVNGNIPLLTTKRTFFRGIVTELLWFMRGSTNVQELREKKVHIWDGNSTREFLDSHGLAHRKEWEVGPTYGHNFRHYGAPYIDATTDYTGQGVDQVADGLVIEYQHTLRLPGSCLFAEFFNGEWHALGKLRQELQNKLRITYPTKGETPFIGLMIQSINGSCNKARFRLTKPTGETMEIIVS